MSALGGIQPCPIANQPDGTLAIEDIRACIRSADVHHPITRLVCLENTQNICGGVPLTLDYIRQVSEVARQNDLALHIDGARIFNAATAQHASVKDLVDSADSVMFCLSKGLAAPIGSILVGTNQFVTRARHIRKMLGGGMRQVGVVAAAGIISLQKMTKRLGEDHARARKLADGLRQVYGLVVDANSPHTNMVYLNLSADVQSSAHEVTQKMKDLGVLVDPENARRFRLVTHYEIDDPAVETTIAAFKQILS
jgi:threonine aldolase